MTNLKSSLNRFSERIKHLDWNTEQSEHNGSNIRLLKESAIRFARWTLHLECMPESVSTPFYNIAECQAPGLCPSSEFDIGTISNSIARTTLPWMHQWYWLLDTQGEIELKEPDPFEPLLLCFVRGGRPYHHDGFLHIEHSISFAYGYGKWLATFSEMIPTPLDEIDLLKIDTDFRERSSSA